MKVRRLVSALLMVSGSLVIAPVSSAQGNGGGKKKAEEGAVDIYLYHGSSYGIRGDEGSVVPGPDSVDATLYAPSSGDCIAAGKTVRADTQGDARLFAPGGECASGPDRVIRIRSEWDLDQDGRCIHPYQGKNPEAFCFAREVDEDGIPDDIEDPAVTMHLNGVLLSGGTTTVNLQIRILEYDPNAGDDPGPADWTYWGSQDRAFIISVVDGASVTSGVGGNPNLYGFENSDADATLCEVVWKRRSHSCEPRGVIYSMDIKGVVDATKQQ